MGLKKEKTTSNGSSGNYWKIVNTNANMSNLQARYTVSLYKNKEFSDEGAPAITSYEFFSTHTKDELIGNLILLGYISLKGIANGEKPSATLNRRMADLWDSLQGYENF